MKANIFKIHAHDSIFRHKVQHWIYWIYVIMNLYTNFKNYTSIADFQEVILNKWLKKVN